MKNIIVSATASVLIYAFMMFVSVYVPQAFNHNFILKIGFVLSFAFSVAMTIRAIGLYIRDKK